VGHTAILDTAEETITLSLSGNKPFFTPPAHCPVAILIELYHTYFHSLLVGVCSLIFYIVNNSVSANDVSHVTYNKREWKMTTDSKYMYICK
jgi:amino acid transporter